MGIQVERLKCKAMLLTSGERVAFGQMLLASLDKDAQRARGRLKSSVDSPMSKAEAFRLFRSPMGLLRFVRR